MRRLKQHMAWALVAGIALLLWPWHAERTCYHRPWPGL